MKEHTPGPWMIDRFKGQPPYLVATKTDVICLFGNHERVRPETIEANAQLIAASPDLLKAAKDMLTMEPVLFARYCSEDFVAGWNSACKAYRSITQREALALAVAKAEEQAWPP